MKDYGLVSIITPSYNCSKFISKTIRSVQGQTYKNWELLITDDCSKDDTCDVIESFAKDDSRIKLFRQTVNGGAGAARNRSISEAKGRYIAFLDGDDMWLPEKLEKQLHFMDTNDIDFCMTRTVEINEEGEKVGVCLGKKRVSHAFNFIINYMDTSAVMYDTTRYGKFYMQNIRKRQDWLLWNDILKKTKFAYCLPEFLTVYVKNGNSLSSNKLSLLKYHTQCFQHQGLPKLLAVFVNYCISIPLFMIKRSHYRSAFKQYKEELDKIIIPA